ncbi:hypothetical protein LPJ61_004889 [Coemansia biformis]|uniref:Carboxymuconolactone decarboxylase-like domain-containing protein n=1 Tax=Coemansia biformis TaxID=1286918 RepID=A0A9W8CX53_9FUNG|nr:hypothetical protein LPJ61_004889 [Coemansia biformis]
MDDCIAACDFDAWEGAAEALAGGLLHLVAVAAAASANRPNAVGHIAQRRLQQLDQPSGRTDFVLQARETVVKMSSLMGMPRAINALHSLAAAVPQGSDLARELAAAPVLRGDADYSHARMRARGLELFSAIYGRHAATVEDRLHALCPDLAEVIVVDSYGRLLGETRRLSARDTELCAVGCLVPLDVPAQLKSHCLGASRLGASDAMVQAAIRLARLVCTR